MATAQPRASGHTTSARRLVTKRPLTKPGGKGGATSSYGGSGSVDEKPSEARGSLMLVAPPLPPSKKTAAAAAATKKRSNTGNGKKKPVNGPLSDCYTPVKESAAGQQHRVDSSVVRQFNSRQEPSPFLDSVYMERRAKALSAMRQRSSA
ncbi:uncharacterized protein BKCO1_100041 [Diplodia corticola]|uniref:Uncharacterized protein n=1 Tax=Diplodia corticola TaxID=236234 RepID=A0A1J9SM63_9PEZI|nr:uncharacterized protein BKCO1_100041 [Diplodia corticola]OJD40812.1 hypothetical protein BKCO1_100041 [Diplodia corticola]